MLLIEYAGTAKSVSNLDDPKEPHFTFVISGRTKGNQLSLSLGFLVLGPRKEPTFDRVDGLSGWSY